VGLDVSSAQPALSSLRNFIIQNHAGLIVFAAGVPLYTPPSKSQGTGRVFLGVSHSEIEWRDPEHPKVAKSGVPDLRKGYLI
tara:strand:- start:335 stop:580 length:246 start_codon:yes stop_codon:yes gene_type:complete